MKKFMSLVTLMSTVWSFGGGFAFAASIREEGARARMASEKKLEQAASQVSQGLKKLVKSGRYNGSNAVTTFRADYRRGLSKMKAQVAKDQKKILSASDAVVESALDTAMARARELGNNQVVSSIQEQRSRGVSARQIIRSVQSGEWEARAVASIENELKQAGGSPNKMLQKQIQRLSSKYYYYYVSAPAVLVVGGAVVWGVSSGYYGYTGAVVIAGEAIFAVGLLALGIWILLVTVAVTS